MDGNGRWATQKRRPRAFGHRAGVKAVRGAVEFCLRNAIPTLTLFAFSSENWQRPVTEVKALMELFLQALDREVDQLHKNAVQLRFIGNLGAFSNALQQHMARATKLTQANDKLTLAIAINYGGRWDITQAAQRAAAALPPSAITEKTLATFLCLSDLPDPDLFIRTGGEQRISNFLLWQLAYCEFYFSNVLWPDFDAACLQHAVAEFAKRERRFGKTGAQMSQRSRRTG